MWLLAFQVVLVGWAWSTGWKGWALIPFAISQFVGIALGVSQALIDLEAGTYGEASEPIFLGVLNVLTITVLFIMAVVGRNHEGEKCKTKAVNNINEHDRHTVALKGEAKAETGKDDIVFENIREPHNDDSFVSNKPKPNKGHTQYRGWKHKEIGKVPVIAYLSAGIMLLLFIIALSELIYELNRSVLPDRLYILINTSIMIVSTLICIGLLLRNYVAYIAAIFAFSALFLWGLIPLIVSGLDVISNIILFIVMLISSGCIYGLLISLKRN